MLKRLQAEHGILYSRGNDTLFGYFGWPTVAKLDSRTLLVGASGFRTQHIDPFGKTTLFRSNNAGRSWEEPFILNDSPIDDRDVGVTALRDGRVLVSWFSQDTRIFAFPPPTLPKPKVRTVTTARIQRFDIKPILDTWDDAVVAANVGSFIRIRDAEGNWGPRIEVPVTAPHGPVELRDGRLFYVGAFAFKGDGSRPLRERAALSISADSGATWSAPTPLPVCPGEGAFCEPHSLELPSGRILVHLRNDNDFTTWQCHTDDGGKTWSEPKLLTVGAPSHLLRHSSGAIIATYGYRRPGYGQRVLLSYDDGASYEQWILRDDGFGGDLGYPSTVELDDGTLYSVYYQKTAPDALNCSLLTSHWELPER